MIYIYFLPIIVIILIIIVYKLNINYPEQSVLFDTIKNVSITIGTTLAVIGYTYDINKRNDEYNSRYAQYIIEQFNLIDDNLLNNYDDYKYIFNIFYNKINFPSSLDKNTNNSLFIKKNKKIKDKTFILLNKITFLLEKIYTLDKNLFENNLLGYKIRLYIDNSVYYEYWRINYMIYSYDFYKFLENKYFFLKLNSYKYYKPDNNLFNIEYTKDKNFIFKN